MLQVLIGAGAAVLYLWITPSVVMETGWRIWPYARCDRCRGAGRWRTGTAVPWRYRYERGARKWVSCSLCRGFGVRWHARLLVGVWIRGVWYGYGPSQCRLPAG